MEHTFAHAGHETVWEHASPLTPGDLAWLDARCAAVGIELVGCRNSLGHFERWLRHDAYRPMAECPDGFEFLPGVHMPAGTLAPNPENAAFAVGLIREMTSHLTSRQVNVCADEPFELGKGVSAARCAAEGKEAVYVEHLRQIVGPLVDEGFAVRFWADVIRHAPHLASRLPEGSTAIAWEYEAPRPHGDAPLLPAAMASVLANAGIDFGDGGGFADQVPDLASTGFPFWVAPGTSSWNSLVGRIDNAVANLIDAAESGLAHGAGGYLITDWGDNGHLQPPAVSDGPMLFGGAVAWCLDANRDLDVAALLDRHAYDDPSGRLGAAAVDLGRLWGATGQRAANGSPIQKALLPHQALFVSGKPEVDRVVDVLDRIDAAMASIGAAEPRCPDGRLVAREWMLAAKLARAGAVRMLARARASESPAIDFSGLIEEASACWILRSRPGGLSDSVAHLERTAAGAL